MSPKSSRPKIPFAKGRGKCIFCGEYGVTKEHYWGNWLKNHIPRVIPYRQHEGRRLFKVSPIDDPELEYRHFETVRSHQQGDPHGEQLKVVCKPCNTGWMSDLQEDAKPILLSYMNGDWINLTEKQQEIFAAWVSMFTMVSERKHPQTAAVPEEQRDYLYRQHKAPRGWFIFVGRYDGYAWAGAINHFGLSPAPGIIAQTSSFELPATEKLPSSYRAQCTTFTLRRLVIFAYSSSDPVTFNPLTFERQFHLRAIWPRIAGQLFTPRGVHNDFSVDALSNCLVPDDQRASVRHIWDPF